MAEDSIASDALFVLRAKVRQARAMSPEAKFRAGPELFAEECQRMKEQLRNENSDASEEEVHRLLVDSLKRQRKLDEMYGR